MWREPILARALLRLNAATAPELRERLEDMRLLWLAGRVASLAAFAVTAALLPLGAPWPAALPLMIVAVFVLNEVVIAVAQRARSVPRFDAALTASGMLLVTWAALLMYLTPEIAWVGVIAFALVVSTHGTALSARALAIFVVYASAAFAVVSRLLTATGSAETNPFIQLNHEFAGLTIAPLPLALPVLGGLAYAVGARVRQARRRALATAGELSEAQQWLAESHEELRQWSEHLESEVARKTEQLEERNRHLSIVNATSFALRESIEDAPALERALRLVARLLEAKAAQTCMLGPAGDAGPENLLLVATDPEEPLAAIVPTALLQHVAESAMPIFSENDHSLATELSAGWGGGLGELAGFAIVPLTAKEEPLGSLAVSGRAERSWSEPERRPRAAAALPRGARSSRAGGVAQRGGSGAQRGRRRASSDRRRTRAGRAASRRADAVAGDTPRGRTLAGHPGASAFAAGGG